MQSLVRVGVVSDFTGVVRAMEEKSTAKNVFS